MKKFLSSCFIIVFLASSWASSGQKSVQLTLDSIFNSRGEVYFKFFVRHRDDIRTLSSEISIDRVKGDEVFAYANRKEFDAFMKHQVAFTLLQAPGTLLSQAELNPCGTNRPLNTSAWDFYPTYDQYVGFMAGFATAHPNLCRLDTVGTTVQGRLILAVKISKNVNTDEGEPQLLYTSSIHGDETTGYILMLHLIDYLLSGYGTDPVATNLLNTTEIFINPLANPDGTYHGGNGSVSGAIRYNANGIDLNRNYPDPQAGQHPDGNAWQPETQAWMAYASANRFTMSANFHGGSEVFNYPWDTWSKLTADDDWWQFVAREWADTVHKYGPAGYFTDQNNGITNGYQWYYVTGGRQDYMNYFQHCREVTVELSYTKLLPANQLVNYWNYNYHTFLNYINETHFGFNGVVTDTVTDLPLAAKVYITLHDMDNSEMYSHQPSGFYARPIYDGSYNVTFSAAGYFSKTVSSVNTAKYTTHHLDVQLKPLTYGLQDRVVNSVMVFPNPSDGHFSLNLPDHVNPSCSVQVINTFGKIVYSSEVAPGTGTRTVPVNLAGLPEGLYFVEFNSGYQIYFDKLIIRR